MIELSIIVPVHNEENNILFLSDRIRRTLGALNYELIWINDGSTDGTNKKIIEYADERTILVDLAGNFGQSAAMQAGIHFAKANVIAFLDGDGQNDPADILPMYKLFVSGKWDLVAGVRANRIDPFLKKIPSTAANWLIRKLTRSNIKDLGCTLRLIRRSWAMTLPLKNGMHRYINLLLAKKGAVYTQVNVNHSPRLTGKSKYGWGRLFPVLRDLWNILKDRSISTVAYTHHHYKIARYWKANQATPTFDKAIG
jgi:glycosyltransferase involved in cell wall biosynthesis